MRERCDVGDVLYFHHGSSREHDPRVFLPEHPDIPERIDAIEAALEGAGWAGCSRVQAPAATFAELELVHEPMLVRQIRRMSLSGGGQLDEDTFVGEASYTAALHAAGGACAMVRALGDRPRPTRPGLIHEPVQTQLTEPPPPLPHRRRRHPTRRRDLRVRPSLSTPQNDS